MRKMSLAIFICLGIAYSGPKPSPYQVDAFADASIAEVIDLLRDGAFLQLVEFSLVPDLCHVQTLGHSKLKHRSGSSYFTPPC